MRRWRRQNQMASAAATVMMAAMNAGRPSDSTRIGMMPTLSLITGLASLTAAIAPAPPANMAALASH